MNSPTSKVRLAEGGHMTFYCPGCKTVHAINVSAGRWSWNGDHENPTISPSILATSGHYVVGREHEGCWCKHNAEHPDEDPDFTCNRCHSFIREGRIEYLSDCSHDLAGQTIDLPLHSAYRGG